MAQQRWRCSARWGLAMAIDLRLGQVTRVTGLRRDKAERAMAQSAATHRAREEALEEAKRDEARTEQQLDAAHQAFRADPGCAQAQLWRQISKEQRERARVETAERVEMRDQSEEALGEAKLQFQRSNERHRLSQDAVRKDIIQHRKTVEEREADELQGMGQASGNGLSALGSSNSGGWT